MTVSIFGLAAEPKFGEDLSDEKIELDRRLKQVRINAQVRQAELLAERALERQRDATNRASSNQSDIPSQSKKWGDIETSAEFKAMSAEDQAKAKHAYFDRWIAPLVGNQADELRIKFLQLQTGISRAISLFLIALATLGLSLFGYRRRQHIVDSFNAMQSVGAAILKHSKGIAALLIAITLMALVARVIFGSPLVLFIR